MATEKVELSVTTCDGCGKRIVQDPDLDDHDPVLGYHGHVFHHYKMGGNSAEWFACRDRCVKNAVVNSLQKALDPDGHDPGPNPPSTWVPIESVPDDDDEREALLRRVHGEPDDPRR